MNKQHFNPVLLCCDQPRYGFLQCFNGKAKIYDRCYEKESLINCVTCHRLLKETELQKWQNTYIMSLNSYRLSPEQFSRNYAAVTAPHAELFITCIALISFVYGCRLNDCWNSHAWIILKSALAIANSNTWLILKYWNWLAKSIKQSSVSVLLNW